MVESAARDAVQEAIALRRFPPKLCLPEQLKGSLLSTWLSCPTFTWAPECLTETRKPLCIVENCTCTPAVKEYTSRTVHDIEHKTTLYYARYACRGVGKGRTFSTIDDEYISSSKTTLLEFPYLLTYKSGISVRMFDSVYDSMLTTKGISGATQNVTRRRQKRFYQITARAAMAVEDRRLENPSFTPPMLPTVDQYMANNASLDEESLQQIWLAQTDICSRLLEAQMAQSKCTRVIRMDHSQKFCSKLKVFEANGKKDQVSTVRMLLLVQNEVGQIIARGLTRSENHDESAAILRSVVPKLDGQPNSPVVCVTDNANQNRGMIQKVFGSSVLTKQDPFHVIQRFTEKITDQAQRKALAKQLSQAMYDIGNNIRTPEVMADRCSAVLRRVQPSDVRVSASIWENCIEANLKQIQEGDLYVDDNEYLERGKKVRVVSTSQLEAVHSKLRKLLDRIVSIPVGLRILDIFLLRHNLKTGAKFKRNPSFAEFDFISLCQTAVICRGLLPESPQIEFILQLLAFKLPETSVQERLRPGAESSANRPWERVYDLISISTSAIEAKMLRKRAQTSDIKQYLSSAYVRQKLVDQKVFVKQLGLEPEYESTVEFSSNEFTLLEEVRSEQMALDVKKFWWNQCPVVATVLFNAAVCKIGNPSLQLRKRSFSTIERYLAAIDVKLQSKSTLASASTCTMLPLLENKDDKTRYDTIDSKNSAEDEWLQKTLFNLLRGKGTIKNKTQVFCNVYDLAGYLCPAITRKTIEWLRRRWCVLRAAENRLGRMKIVLRVPPEMLERETKSKPCPTTSLHAAASNDEHLTIDSSDDLGQIALTDSDTAPVVTPPVPDTHALMHPNPESNLAESGVALTSATCATLLLSPQPITQPTSAREVGAVSTVEQLPGMQSELADFEVIDDATREQLRQYAASIPRTKGKWTMVLQAYMTLNPATKLSAENLRCRLKGKRHAAQHLPRPPTLQSGPTSQPSTRSDTNVDAREIISQPQQESKKRPACESCRTTKRKCGPDSRNVKCQYRQQSKPTIASFFAAPASRTSADQ